MQVATLMLLPALLVAWMCFKLFRSLLAMEIGMGVGVVLSRYENPILFWAVITIQCAAVGGLFAVIWYVVFVLPNRIMS
jgi:hypothetical protein